MDGSQGSGRWRRRVWALVVGCLVAGTVMATGTDADAAPSGSAGTSLRVLQLNLCGSGSAACFTGRSVAEAVDAIRAEAPDVVTLNEICADDVPVLRRALAGGATRMAVGSAFQPVRDRSVGGVLRCRDGQPYGIGLLARWPSTSAGGFYPVQDRRNAEERAWVCLDATAPRAVAVCTTHLAATEPDVTSAQCRYLFDAVVAGMPTPLVLAGDLNLGADALRSCLPTDAVHADDGDVQHVVATPGFAVGGAHTVDLHGSTDHPGLLVTLGRAA